MGGLRLDRTSSIELEPRTLSFSELELAREAAMYILNNKPSEEAIKIFTEGLQPVPRTRDNACLKGDSEEEEEKEEEEDNDVVLMNCLWMDQFYDLYLPQRDTVTAPF
ncbi:hypothetical protein Cni_G10273 [Canna indica]|uniref:Uncharacterized protein n=1 Tax=Canna indica TaxID=4628 RepID=A0AAQ3K9L4_9LILI|nr:hypothetical protein Cni_G10273 [Canna indica]